MSPPDIKIHKAIERSLCSNILITTLHFFNHLIPALLWFPSYNSNFHALCQRNFDLVPIPTSCLCKSVLFFLLTGGEHWSCCKAFSLCLIISCVICQSGSDGGVTWKMTWFIWDCFPDNGRRNNRSGIIILGRKGRNPPLCYCPGSRHPFDCILRKIRSEGLHSGLLAGGSVLPAWYGLS